FGLGLGHHGTVVTGGEVDDAEAPVGDVGDVRALRVGPRVDDRGVDEHARRTGGQVRGVELAGQGERGDRAVGVGRVADDAAGGLAGALPAGTLLGGQVFLAGQEFGGVDELRL